MKKHKLKLDDLKVQSFITSMMDKGVKTIKGGFANGERTCLEDELDNSNGCGGETGPEDDITLNPVNGRRRRRRGGDGRRGGGPGNNGCTDAVNVCACDQVVF